LYTFPKNLPQGQYHIRVNVNGTSALTDTFEITAPTFDCLQPPPWKNVTSISDPKYTSLYLTEPWAGDLVLGKLSNGTGIVIGWSFRVSRIPLIHNRHSEILCLGREK